MGSRKPAPRSEPFGETADTQFFWCGDARSAPLAQVEAAVNGGNLAVACAGASGSGKTAFLYRLAERLSAAGVRFIHPDRVVQCSARASAGPSPHAWEGSKGARSAGKTAEVLLLDDVDQLSRAEMAQLREWWNILREKREQVALVVSCAVSAVDPDSASRRQDLRSMIDTVVALPPLAHADVEEVIRHRLQVAGLECEDVFAQPALEKIAFYAKGTPKRLVQLCSRAITLAEESDTFPVGPDLVKEAAHQLFLPSHLREFSRKISMGLVPVPSSLSGSAEEPSPAPSPAPSPTVETRFERRAYVEPRPPLEIPRTATLPEHTAAAKSLNAVQDHRTIRHDEAAATRPHHSEDAAEQDCATAEGGPGVARPTAKRRRRRGIVSVIAICGIAVITGAIGYVLGQADMKPVEVVRIIPQFDTIIPGDATDSGDAASAGASFPLDGEMAAPSPAPEGADPTPEMADPALEHVDPTPEGADSTPVIVDPVPEGVDPTPEGADSTPEMADPALERVDPAPEGADPTPAIADPVPEIVDREPVVAADSLQPDPSQEDAELEVQAEAADARSSPDAAETANEGEDAQIGGLLTDWTSLGIGWPPAGEDELAELLSRSWTGGGGDGAPASGSGDDVTAIEPERMNPERTSTAAQGPGVTQRSSTPPTSAVGEEREADRKNSLNDRQGDDRQDTGAAAAEEVLASAPAEQEPAIRWRFDSTVMRAQALLAQLDLYRDAIDGLLGNRTIAAIRDFQRGMSMAETGELSEALLAALEQQASTAGSGTTAQEHAQGPHDAVVDAAEDLQVIDIMSECRGKDAEWVYISAINRHVLCGGLSAGAPNPVPTR